MDFLWKSVVDWFKSAYHLCKISSTDLFRNSCICEVGPSGGTVADVLGIVLAAIAGAVFEAALPRAGAVCTGAPNMLGAVEIGLVPFAPAAEGVVAGAAAPNKFGVAEELAVVPNRLGAAGAAVEVGPNKLGAAGAAVDAAPNILGAGGAADPNMLGAAGAGLAGAAGFLGAAAPKRLVPAGFAASENRPDAGVFEVGAPNRLGAGVPAAAVPNSPPGLGAVAAAPNSPAPDGAGAPNVAVAGAAPKRLPAGAAAAPSILLVAGGAVVAAPNPNVADGGLLSPGVCPNPPNIRKEGLLKFKSWQSNKPRIDFVCKLMVSHYCCRRVSRLAMQKDPHVVLEALRSHPQAKFFQKAVDPSRDGCPDYLDIIREPMDLSRVNSSSIELLAQDVQLMLLNAVRYNHKTHPVYQDALSLAKYFDLVVKPLVLTWKGFPSFRTTKRRLVPYDDQPVPVIVYAGNADAIPRNSQRDRITPKKRQAPGAYEWPTIPKAPLSARDKRRKVKNIVPEVPEPATVDAHTAASPTGDSSPKAPKAAVNSPSNGSTALLTSPVSNIIKNPQPIGTLMPQLVAQQPGHGVVNPNVHSQSMTDASLMPKQSPTIGKSSLPIPDGPGK